MSSYVVHTCLDVSTTTILPYLQPPTWLSWPDEPGGKTSISTYIQKLKHPYVFVEWLHVSECSPRYSGRSLMHLCQQPWCMVPAPHQIDASLADFLQKAWFCQKSIMTASLPSIYLPGLWLWWALMLLLRPVRSSRSSFHSQRHVRFF